MISPCGISESYSYSCLASFTCKLVVMLVDSVQFPKGLRSLRESLMEHYRQSCRWWAAVDLARRFLFLLLVVLLPGNQVGCLFLISQGTKWVILMGIYLLNNGHLWEQSFIHRFPLVT